MLAGLEHTYHDKSLLSRKNEVSWILPDKLAASCHLRWCPSQAALVLRDSQYMHQCAHPPLLPGVTALQQGSDRLPEFTYKPFRERHRALKQSAGQEQHRRFKDQQLEPLAQKVHTCSVHQHSLQEEDKNPSLGRSTSGF